MVHKDADNNVIAIDGGGGGANRFSPFDSCRLGPNAARFPTNSDRLGFDGACSRRLPNRPLPHFRYPLWRVSSLSRRTHSARSEHNGDKKARGCNTGNTCTLSFVWIIFFFPAVWSHPDKSTPRRVQRLSQVEKTTTIDPRRRVYPVEKTGYVQLVSARSETVNYFR